MALEKPEVTTNAGTYLFSWEKPEIRAMVERISEDGRHSLNGELTIWHKTLGVEELLEQTRLNLSSNQSRNQLAKSLIERVEDIDWVSVIKYICVLTINEHRKGEPVEEIGHKPETMELFYRLHPILEEGEPTTIFAPGGTLKSYLAGYIAVLVQMNYPGVYGWLPMQGNVLYLDWEASKKLHERRIWAIKQGLGIHNDETLVYRFCTQPFASDIVEIQRLVLEHDIKLAIIDSQVAASGGDVEKADSANQYYNALRSLRCPSLTLDHVPKNTEGGKPLPFGSVFKWNRARSIFELKKYQEAGENTIELGLYHRKHNEGRLIRPCGIRVDFHYDGEVLQKVTFEESDIKGVPELARGLSLKDRIVGCLRVGALAIDELAAELETTKGSVNTQLHRHKDIFIKVDRNLWGLKALDGYI